MRHLPISRKHPAGAAFAGLLVIAACASPGTASREAASATPAEVRAPAETTDARLNAIFEEDWAIRMEASPEWASSIGWPGDHDRWTDFSPAGIEARDRHDRQILERVRAIDPATLSEDARLDRTLFIRNVEMRVAAQAFPRELLVISQMRGPQRTLARTLQSMPLERVEDYEAALRRLRAIPDLLAEYEALLERGLEEGITPPRIALGDVPRQLRGLLGETPRDSPLLAAFTRIPARIPEAEGARLVAEAEAAYTEAVAPAVEAFATFIEETYVPGARASTAFGDVPGGEAWYAHLARQYTTTDLSAEAIHQIGVAEVARIRAEMEAVKAQVGFEGDLHAFFAHLRAEPVFFHESADDLIREYRDIAKRADAALPALFGKLPRLPYGVEPVPPHLERGVTTAYYIGGSLEAGRAGIFYANTYNLEARPRWEMEALTLHEAMPGHHLQIALAQEQGGVPEFRRRWGTTAFVEGWALYAERLGLEMPGLYEDPIMNFGRLVYEMWRAIRLVVDTGIHVLGWSRQEAIDYFREHSPRSLHDITVEVDRYLVMPGQALAYKIGELKIRELRSRAEDALGEDFSVRDFHDAVLEAGAMPLEVLEERIDAWIAGQQAQASGR
jgi:uncharacterized protein (DUF885 family)